MTDEQINAAIAKELGWTQVEAIHRSGRAPGATYVGREFIPDFCSDLNAIHDAEKVLSPKDEGMYFLTLKQIVGDLIWYRDTYRNYRATARERAEAFLRALGKWEEATTEESSVDQREVQK